MVKSYVALAIICCCAHVAVSQTIRVKATNINELFYAAGYGAKCDNTTDDSAAIQAAIDDANSSGNGVVVLPPGTCYVHAGLVVKSYVTLSGGGAHFPSGNLRYDGTDFAVDQSSAGWCGLKDLYIYTTNASATGIKMGNNSQHCRLDNVYVDASSTSGNTGSGLLLDGTSTNTQFSGHLVIDGFYAIGYKYGWKWTGGAAQQIWTTVDATNVFLLGPSHASGSIGFWMTGTGPSGGGCLVHSGTIENFAMGVQYDNGVYGCDLGIDIENNTSVYSFGNAAQLWFHHTVTGEFYSQSANGTSNLWDKERRYNGAWYSESRDDRFHVTWNDSTLQQEWGWKRGASLIAGGSPANAFVVHTSTSGDLLAPERNFIRLWVGVTESYGAASPASGTWTQGSIVWNVNGTLGQPIGWICTTAGSPGTWTPFGGSVAYNAAGTLQVSVHEVYGSAALNSGTPSTATITLSGGAIYSSSSSYKCTVTNETTQANTLKIVYTDGSHFAITGPNSVTDSASYRCIGN